MDEIAIIGGYVTISGAVAVLKREGIRLSGRSVLTWLRGNRIPCTKVGQTLVFPQHCLSRLVEDYRDKR